MQATEAEIEDRTDILLATFSRDDVLEAIPHMIQYCLQWTPVGEDLYAVELEVETTQVQTGVVAIANIPVRQVLIEPQDISS